MRILFLTLILLSGTCVYGQIYSGIGLDYSTAPFSNNLIDYYANLILIGKKPIGTDLSILGSIGYRNYKSKVSTLTKDSDFERFFKATYPEKILPLNTYITNSTSYSFNYIPLSAGIEFKITTFARIQYNLEASLLIQTNSTVKSYMQYSAKSVNRLPITHDLSVHFHIKGSGLFFGVSTLPAFVKEDLVYNYRFMIDMNQKTSDAFMFHFGARQNFAGSKRKRKVV